jgi:hypothetical protein
MSTFYHFVIKTVPRDGSAVKKVKIFLQNSMLLRAALQLVGTKCATGSIIAQRLALNCDAMLEKAYCNPSTGRKNFKTPLICIHCCGSGSNLHSHSELHNAGLTGGKECYPICRTCVIAGKTPVARTGAKKRNSQANKEDSERDQRLRTELGS